VRRIERAHRPARGGRLRHAVAHGQVLELGQNRVGVVQAVQAQRALDRGIAVEAGPAIADLHDPGPDGRRRRGDGDGAGGFDGGAGHMVVAG
jgi:hypothetical protein